LLRVDKGVMAPFNYLLSTLVLVLVLVTSVYGILEERGMKEKIYWENAVARDMQDIGRSDPHAQEFLQKFISARFDENSEIDINEEFEEFQRKRR